MTDTLETLRADLDALSAQVAKCPYSSANNTGSVPAKLLITEDFSSGGVTSPYLEFFSSTPQAYQGSIKPFTNFAGQTCGHYYAQQGTNEKTPWEVMLTHDKVPQLDKSGSLSEFCLEWREHFVGGYPFPTAGQKMLRVGFDDSTRPESRKTVDLACLDSGANLQFAAYWGKDQEWFRNTGKRHPMDQWVIWRVWLKLNTPGQSDGFVRVFQNGQQFIGGESLKLRTDSDTQGFNFLWIGGNYSMRSGIGGLASNGHRYITGIRLWNTSPE